MARVDHPCVVLVQSLIISMMLAVKFLPLPFIGLRNFQAIPALLNAFYCEGTLILSGNAFSKSINMTI